MRREIVVAFAALFAACSSPPDPFAAEDYGFDPQSSFESRVGACPPFVLRWLRELDGMPGYEQEPPTARARAVVMDAYAGLPEEVGGALKERLIAVCFVRGLKGNGFTYGVTDAHDRFHAVMLLNPAGLTMSASQMLAQRDATAFKGPLPGLSVEAGDLPGTVLTFAHEAAHAYDYVRRLTPYPTPEAARNFPERYDKNESWEVWRTINEPKDPSALPGRERLRFYGVKPPELEPSEAPRLYAALAGSPFVSLYAAQTWTEDAAEMFAVAHLTTTLGRPYAFKIGGRTIKPMEGPAGKRARRLYGRFKARRRRLR